MIYISTQPARDLYCYNNLNNMNKLDKKINQAWRSMLYRCDNPHDKRYKDYGGRGIKVCPEWQEFSNFYRDMGSSCREGLSLDRIDNDGNYQPGNCRWATPQEQSRNTRTCTKLTYKGMTKGIIEWANGLGIKADTLHGRIKDYGWDVKLALSLEVTPRSKRHIRNVTHNGSTMSVTEWSTITGIAPGTIICRLNRGWSVEDALYKRKIPYGYSLDTI